MAFSTHIVRRGVVLCPYVTISGLPYIWSNGNPPQGWETAPGSGLVEIDGEAYTWLKTLEADTDFASVAQSANATGGIGVTGEHTFRFAVAGDVGAASDAWLSIAYADSIARAGSAVSRGLEPLSPVEVIDYQIENAAAFEASGVVHVALEAIAYATKTTGAGESLDTLTRGAYGSTARHHMGGDDLAEAMTIGGAPFVSEHPLAWQGRTVRLWLAPCRRVGSALVPESAAARGAEDVEAFAGILDDIKGANGGTEIGVTALGLLHVMAQEVATRLPRAVAGFPDGKRLQVADDNRTLYWTWIVGTDFRDDLVTEIQTVYRNAVDLTIINSSYSFDEISGGLNSTFALGDQPTLPTSIGAVSVRTAINADYKAVVTVSASDETVGAYWNLRIDGTPGDSFWRELGFTTLQEATPAVEATRVTYTFTADRPLPVFRLPAGNGLRRIYYHTPTGPNFDATPGYVTDAGADIDGALRIGDKEIVEFNSSGSQGGFAYLSISARGAYGSDSREEIYVEWAPAKPKPIEIVQGLGFSGCGDLRTALYLLLGGSGEAGFNHATYDQGWRGSGAFVAADLIDVTSFETLNSKTQPPEGRDNRFIPDATSLREWLHGVLVETQSFPVATWTATDGRFKLRVKQARPPRESDRLTAHVLDRSVTWTGGPDKAEVEIDQGKIVNSAVVRTGLNNAAQKWLQTQQSTDSTSVGTWGRKDRLNFDVGSTSDPLEAMDVAIDLLGSVYRSLGIPWAIILVPTGSPETWGWQLFDPVLVSHTALPKRLSVGRGITDVLGVIVGKIDMYRGQASKAVRSLLRVLVADYGSSRWGLRAPSCRGVVTNDDEITVEDHAYSASTDALDISWFPVGTQVRIYLRGDEASAELRGVELITGSAMKIDNTSALLGETVIVELAPYNTAAATEYQQSFAHQSDGDGILNKAGGLTDLAYRWL